MTLRSMTLGSIFWLFRKRIRYVENSFRIKNNDYSRSLHPSYLNMDMCYFFSTNPRVLGIYKPNSCVLLLLILTNIRLDPYKSPNRILGKECKRTKLMFERRDRANPVYFFNQCSSVYWFKCYQTLKIHNLCNCYSSTNFKAFST